MAVSRRASIVERFVPAIIVLMVGLAFMVGILWDKVSSLEKGKTAGVTTVASPAAGAAAQPAQPTVSLDTIKGLFSQNLIKFGDANRKALFVEVGDPSCPFCHVADGADPTTAAQVGDQFKYVSAGGTYIPPVPEMKKLVDSGQASYAFVYFPGHGNGEMGAKALFCAFDQGKFWEAHALIMSSAGYDLQNNTVKNDKTKSQAVADFLSSVVDAKTLKSCLDSGKYDARLTDEQNVASGTLGVNGTPGFFVNSTNFAGAYSWKDMQSVVDAALK